jgi:hypothetical protein
VAKTLTIKVWRGAFALFTIVVLVVTFYFPLIGLGYALDGSADLHSRGEGLLLLSPSVALSIFLAGLLPVLRACSLLSLGLVASLVLLAPAVACARMGFPAAIGSLCAIVYAGTWWLLIRSKLGSSRPQPDKVT